MKTYTKPVIEILVFRAKENLAYSSYNSEGNNPQNPINVFEAGAGDWGTEGS